MGYSIRVFPPKWQWVVGKIRWILLAISFLVQPTWDDPKTRNISVSLVWVDSTNWSGVCFIAKGCMIFWFGYLGWQIFQCIQHPHQFHHAISNHKWHWIAIYLDGWCLGTCILSLSPEGKANPRCQIPLGFRLVNQAGAGCQTSVKLRSASTHDLVSQVLRFYEMQRKKVKPAANCCDGSIKMTSCGTCKARFTSAAFKKPWAEQQSMSVDDRGLLYFPLMSLV